MKHPRPWKALPGDEIEGEGRRCDGIVDANGHSVVVTDSGFYPPDLETAQLIVDAVNAYAVKP